MQPLLIKFAASGKAIPPQPIRIKTPGLGGAADKMEDGANPQPWHCLPFVEGSTYGLELVYQYETTCHVVHDNGTIRFDWDFASEPGAVLTGGEFVAFSPLAASKFFMFNTMLDIEPPPGYVIRSEPHPRCFTDDTGTVPLALISHVQGEWYPRLLFVVFRGPRPGECFIFRKGEPFAQIIFVPQRSNYQTVKMSAEEEERRRELMRGIQTSRSDIAEHAWKTSDAKVMDNHYKVLARAFALDGLAGVQETVRTAAQRHKESLPTDKTVAECVAIGTDLMRKQQFREARAIYAHIIEREPNNAEALSNLGACVVCLGNAKGLEIMDYAVQLQPRVARYHSNIGEMLRQLGRLPEAEAAFRASLLLQFNDPGIWSVLGLTLAQQGRLDEGLQACRTALVAGAALPAVHFRMGWILAQRRQYGEARACYEAALRLDANFADARKALAELPGFNS